ncbi:PepSY domain-containing protein [Mucilaginibacter sp.]
MTISVWRYSHLALAVSSFILLTLASVTGIILSFEPVSQKLQPYRAQNFNEITLAQALPVLRAKYKGISELTVDASQFVQIKGSDAQGKNMLAYADPRTGRILGVPKKQSGFFQWITTFHRSLFLHTAGRFFIGLTAFLLMLITLSGTALIIQRQRGVKRFFTRIVKENFAQYYHVVLGRLSLIPILIIALTGTYLSLEKFNIISSPKVAGKVDFDAIRSKPAKKEADFAVFKQTKLSRVQSIEFPFSEDAEDYYTIKLDDREITVNQITGDLLSEAKYPATAILANLSLNLHTGRASAVWAIILAIASANILFFIYSGFVITFKRLSGRVKNKYKARECRFILLVGSENGSTYRYANAVHQRLLKQGEKSCIAELNRYQAFPKAEHLLVFTSTYGIGDAPSNGNKFTALLRKHPQQQPVKYSVLGFGSHAYPDFCKFAFEVNQLLSHQTWAQPLTDVHTVNDKSPEEFSLWAEAWSQSAGIALNISPAALHMKPPRLHQFKVMEKVQSDGAEDTFLLRLQPGRGLSFTSGDLLAVYPANDHRERLYSIGRIGNEVQLSVRLHQHGLGSGHLHRLTAGNTLAARIVDNRHFHLPATAPEVVMISNGTGIAPFLGMISQNSRKTSYHLYCGFRTRSAFAIYQPLLDAGMHDRRLDQLHLALSREDEKQYVSHLITRDAEVMARVLTTGGVIMLCGSLSMQKDVIDALNHICRANNGKEVSYYQSRGQILMDCY